MTVSGKQSSNAPLQFHQVTKLRDNSFYVKAIRITFGDYKHHYQERPFSVVVHRQSNGVCPVLCLLEYLEQCNYAGDPFLGFTLVNLSLEVRFHVFFHLLSRNAV